MDFKDLVGTEQKFYGASENRFKLGRYVFEAVADEDDDYRSMMEDIKAVEDSTTIFFKRPIAIVKVEELPRLEGYQLVDTADNHVWLEMGTDDYDDYYPCFTFYYQPKPPKSAI